MSVVQQRFSNQFIEIIKMSNHSLGPSAVSYVETVSIWVKQTLVHFYLKSKNIRTKKKIGRKTKWKLCFHLFIAYSCRLCMILHINRKFVSKTEIKSNFVNFCKTLFKLPLAITFKPYTTHFFLIYIHIVWQYLWQKFPQTSHCTEVRFASLDLLLP